MAAADPGRVAVALGGGAIRRTAEDGPAGRDVQPELHIGGEARQHLQNEGRVRRPAPVHGPRTARRPRPTSAADSPDRPAARESWGCRAAHRPGRRHAHASPRSLAKERGGFGGGDDLVESLVQQLVVRGELAVHVLDHVAREPLGPGRGACARLPSRSVRALLLPRCGRDRRTAGWGGGWRGWGGAIGERARADRRVRWQGGWWSSLSSSSVHPSGLGLSVWCLGDGRSLQRVAGHAVLRG